MHHTKAQIADRADNKRNNTDFTMIMQQLATHCLFPTNYNKENWLQPSNTEKQFIKHLLVYTHTHTAHTYSILHFQDCSFQNSSQITLTDINSVLQLINEFPSLIDSMWSSLSGSDLLRAVQKKNDGSHPFAQPTVAQKQWCVTHDSLSMIFYTFYYNVSLVSMSLQIVVVYYLFNCNKPRFNYVL